MFSSSRVVKSRGDQLMSSSGKHNYQQYCDLPSRETEFRVCVNIHEARNLEGIDWNPVVRVVCKCGREVKKTKSVTGSINPKFNEVSILQQILYTFITCTCLGEELFLQVFSCENDGKNFRIESI